MSHLFPYFLTRIGGAPVDLIRVEEAQAYALANQIAHLRTAIFKAGQELSDALFEEIGATQDEEAQKNLLNLKRHCFNGRQIDAASVQAPVSEKTEALFQAYQKLWQELHGNLERYEHVFTPELELQREQVKQAIQNDAIKRGMSLSSHILLANLPKFIDRPVGRFRKKELKAEESLLKYLTRTCAKTSPFSFFTQLAVGEINGNAWQAQFTGASQSNTTLNNMLLSYFKAVLQQIPSVADAITLRLNPTLTQQQNQILYLTNNQNVEAFQRIDQNPLIELFTEFFGSEHPQGLARGAAIKALLDGEYVDASEEELRGFLDSLVGYGLLEWDFEVSGIDPYWDKKLIALLHQRVGSENPAVQKLTEALSAARQFAETFGTIAPEQRWQQLKQTFTPFKEAALQLHAMAGLPEEERLTVEELRKKQEAEKAAVQKESSQEATEKTAEEQTPFTHSNPTYFHYKQEQFLYEDVAAQVSVKANTQEMEQLIAPLRKLYPLLQPLEGFTPEHERMVAFYRDFFPEQERISLLEFYEAYYREVKVPEHKAIAEYKEARKKDPKANPPQPKYKATNTEKKQQEAKDQLHQYLEKNSHITKDAIHIKTESINERLDKGSKTLSVSGFFQPYYENGKLKGVCNSMFPGYGKMFSRFLHLFPEEITQELVHANESGKGESIYVENTDASYFNANLHPPLMSREIKTPGGHNSVSKNQQIPVTELVVQPKSDTHLQLIHEPTGKEVSMFDLGFQGHKGRSELYQLLCRFTHAEMVMLSSVIQWANTAHQKQYPNTAKPQIWLDDTLCIQRQTWDIAKENLPELPQHFTDAQVYETIVAWAKKYNLPQQVFVKAVHQHELQELEPDVAQKIGRDAYKPQYIDFEHIPLVCNLFKKLLAKVPKALHLSEMLPNTQQMVETNHGQYVSELMIQWYE